MVFSITISSKTILFIIVLMPRNSVVGCDALSVFNILRNFLVHHAGGWRSRRVAHFGSRKTFVTDKICGQKLEQGEEEEK